MTHVRSKLLIAAIVGSAWSLSPGCASDDARRAANAAQANAAIALDLDELGRARGAIHHYEAARELDPKGCQWVARRLAPLYASAGDPVRAAREYECAERLDPNDPELLCEIGAFDYAQGRFRPAERRFRRAIALEPTLRDAWLGLGFVMGARGDYETAYHALAQALSDGEARTNLAMLMTHRGDDDAAAEQMDAAIRGEPDLKRYNAALQTIRRRRHDAQAH